MMKTTLVGVAVVAVLLGAGCEEQCDPDVIGTICTIAGSGSNGYDLEADTTALDALDTRLSLPQDTLAAPDGSLYILDWNNHRLRHLTLTGKVEWVAGSGELGGNLDDPETGDFNHPTNMIFDPTGTQIIMAAWHNSKIRIVDIQTGDVVDSCGTGGRQYFGDDGPALTATLDLPASIAFDPVGNLVIMDQANQVLRQIDREGNISRLAGRCVIDEAAPAGPGPCAEPVQCPADAEGRPSGKYTCGDPSIYCFPAATALPCTPGYGGDEGPATEMRMHQPFGQAATPAGRILFDPDGNLYFADTGNHLIRMVDTEGIVHRVAGQVPVDGVPQYGYAGDGGPAVDALINYPVDLALDEDGTLYFTDVNNHCVRAIDSGGIVTTVAGTCGVKGYEGDGRSPTEALLSLPFGLEVANGRLYISDTGNSVIRSVRLR